jgi:hypothetical protein
MTGTSTPNPFDPASLRLDQNFAETVGVKKLLTTVPVRKANRQDFVRVHPDPAYRLTPAAIIELKEDREVYLVTPQMAMELPGEFKPAALFTSTNRQGVVFLWPVKLPGPDAAARRQSSLISQANFEDDTFEPDEAVDDSDKVLRNVLDTIKQSRAVADAYRKILKASPFDREAKMPLHIVIEPTASGRKWTAHIGDRVLCVTASPFVKSARLLSAEGHPPQSIGKAAHGG